jgi:hypothetical protein
MPNANAAVDVDAIDAAIASVLQAEETARTAVARCAADADGRVQAARDGARAIAERAARRIARVHAFAEEKLQTRLAEIEQARSALGQSMPALTATPDHLRVVIAQLAAELTTEPP